MRFRAFQVDGVAEWSLVGQCVASRRSDAEAEISTCSFDMYLIWYIAVAFDPAPAPIEQIMPLPRVQPATSIE